MDRAVDPAAAEEGRVRGVHDCVDGEPGDVGAHRLQLGYNRETHCSAAMSNEPEVCAALRRECNRRCLLFAHYRAGSSRTIAPLDESTSR